MTAGLEAPVGVQSPPHLARWLAVGTVGSGLASGPVLQVPPISQVGVTAGGQWGRKGTHSGDGLSALSPVCPIVHTICVARGCKEGGLAGGCLFLHPPGVARTETRLPAPSPLCVPCQTSPAGTVSLCLLLTSFPNCPDQQCSETQFNSHAFSGGLDR